MVGKIPVLGRLRYAIDGLFLLAAALRMARLLRRLRVDVVHTHIFSSMLIGRVAAVIARVPIRVAMIASPLHLESVALRRIDLWTHRLDHRLLAGCQHTNDLYGSLGVSERFRRTVGYGIDPTGFEPAAANGRRVRRELGLADGTPVVGQVAWFYPVLMPPRTCSRRRASSSSVAPTCASSWWATASASWARATSSRFAGSLASSGWPTR